MHDDGGTQGHTNVVTAVCTSPDGSIVVSGSMDKTVRAWEMGKLALLRKAAVAATQHVHPFDDIL